MGSIEVICGSMFSGKTEELIRRIQELNNTNLNYKVFKPEIDKRNVENKILSHSKKSIDAINIKKLKIAKKYNENFKIFCAFYINKVRLIDNI